MTTIKKMIAVLLAFTFCAILSVSAFAASSAKNQKNTTCYDDVNEYVNSYTQSFAEDKVNESIIEEVFKSIKDPIVSFFKTVKQIVDVVTMKKSGEEQIHKTEDLAHKFFYETAFGAQGDKYVTSGPSTCRYGS